MQGGSRIFCKGGPRGAKAGQGGPRGAKAPQGPSRPLGLKMRNCRQVLVPGKLLRSSSGARMQGGSRICLKAGQGRPRPPKAGQGRPSRTDGATDRSSKKRTILMQIWRMYRTFGPFLDNPSPKLQIARSHAPPDLANVSQIWAKQGPTHTNLHIPCRWF